METVKHSIKIYRGEQFTIDKPLVNKDNSPYIVPNSFDNPHFLLSISDKLYEQKGRIVKNYWLPLYKTFELTRPIKTSEIHDFNFIQFDDKDGSCIVNFKNGDSYEFYYDSAVYYVDHDLNDVNYGKYVIWDFETYGWIEYGLSVTCSFTTKDTANWKPMSYYYTIQLVTGLTLREYLEALADKYGIDYSSTLPELTDFNADDYTSDDRLIELLKLKGYVFPDDFTSDQKLGLISTSVPILSPTELIVTNYMQGGVLNG